MRVSFGAALYAVPADSQPDSVAQEATHSGVRVAEVIDVRRVVPGLNVFHMIFRWIASCPPLALDQVVHLLSDKDPAGTFRHYAAAGDTGEGDTFALCVGRKPSGQVSPGLTSANPGDILLFKVSKSNIPMPQPHENVVIVANGTGIASFRAMLQEMASSQRGRSGTVLLLEGAQTPSKFLYKSELEEWAEQIGLDKCTIEGVYSEDRDRDRPYAQHRFEDLLADPGFVTNLRNPNTRLYACGHEDLNVIQDLLSQIPAEPGGDGKESLLQRMNKEKRLHIRVF